jgi:hypothetical protein
MMEFDKVRISRNPQCTSCAGLDERELARIN